MKKIKVWFKENGLVGFGSLAVAGIAIALGWWVVSNVAVAFFLGMNWEIIKKIWKEEYKDKVEDKVEDIVDNVKEKIKKKKKKK